MTSNDIRVRPVVRYIVTEWKSKEVPDGASSCSLETIGEFDSAQAANRVALSVAQGTSCSLTLFYPPEGLRLQPVPPVEGEIIEPAWEIASK